MSKYKFFPISDESKEAIKIFNSPNLTSAERFKKLFTVEKIK